MLKKTLVTGGTGFIGSHTCLELVENFDKLTFNKNEIIKNSF